MAGFMNTELWLQLERYMITNNITTTSNEQIITIPGRQASGLSSNVHSFLCEAQDQNG